MAECRSQETCSYSQAACSAQSLVSVMSPTDDRTATIHKNQNAIMKDLNDTVFHHAFFHGMKPDHLGILVEGAKVVQFKAGDFLFHEGQPANQLYLIESGRVVLEAHEPADGTALVQTLGAGDVLGWSWLFPPFLWNFQARAIEPTSAVVLSGAHLLTTAERDHDFGYELMKRVAHVVIQRLQATRKQLLAIHSRPALKG